ncbi:hypothetical protein CPB86DRAFT_762800 [Serendipita vermifera]|nr:hypothetical protein CPB86DRAFT_762800 [Serendipita vermifera]
MLPRTGTTANAQRKGGPRSRSHNEDRSKGTVTGVAIPEAPRGSDGIEDFENLLENNYDQNRPAQQIRTTKNKSPSGYPKNQTLSVHNGSDDLLDRMYANNDFETIHQSPLGPQPRSRPISSTGASTSRSRNADMDYVTAPSPRANLNRSTAVSGLQPSSLRLRSPAFDPTTSLQYPLSRGSHSFGALSRYQDEQPDVDEVMERYVDFNGGIPDDQGTPSPAPSVHSSPPQTSRKIVYSPLADRMLGKPLLSRVDQVEMSSNNASRLAKGKHRADEIEDMPPPSTSPRKSYAKGRSSLVESQDEDQSPPIPSKSRLGRLSERVEQINRSPLIKITRPDATEAQDEPFDDIPPPADLDQPQYNDDLDNNVEVEEVGIHDAPPTSGSEESEEEQPPKPIDKKASKKSKAEVDKPKKKRSRDEEEEGEEPRHQKKKPKSTSAKPPSRARSKTPMVQEDTSYLEELQPPSDVEDDDDEGAPRRSRRAKIAPVKFWLGERLEYDTYKPGSRTQVPTILGVRRVPEPPHTSLSQRRRRRAQHKARSRSRKLESEEPQSRQQSVVPLETGWDDDTEPMGLVVDYETNDEIEKLIAFTAAMVVPKLTEKGHFLYQRIFADEKFIAAGQVIIPANGEKPKKSSKDNTYVFYLIEGAIHVIVHDTKFYLAPGGMFMVPRGNYYYIRNMRDYDAKLFFVQGRLMTQDDFETRSTARAESNRPQSPSQYTSDNIADIRDRRLVSSHNNATGSSPQKRDTSQRPPAVATTSRKR